MAINTFVLLFCLFLVCINVVSSRTLLHSQSTHRGSGIGCNPVKQGGRPCRAVYYNHILSTDMDPLLRLIEKLDSKTSSKLMLQESQLVDHRFLSPNEMRQLTRRVNHQTCPTIFHRPIHYFDFQQVAEVPPVWINLIRNPIHLAVNRFYTRRSEWSAAVPRLFDKCVRQAIEEGPESECAAACLPPSLQMAQVCGHHPSCVLQPSMLGDKQTRTQLLQEMRERAETNLRSNYLLVGLMEKMGTFVHMLETILPKHFTGASKAFRNLDLPEQIKWPHPTNQTLDRLHEYYHEEIRFYNTTKQWFFIKAEACGLLYAPKPVMGQMTTG